MSSHVLRAPVDILIVGPSLAILGGQSVQARHLLAGLTNLPGTRVRFLAVNPRLGPPLAWLQRVKFVRTIVTSLAYGAALIRRVPTSDTLICFSAGYWSFLLAPVPAMLLGRLLRKRVVLYYHTGEADDHLRRHGWFALPLIRLADRVVVPSGFLVEVFARFSIPALAIANVVEPLALPYRERREPVPHFFANRNLEPMYDVGCVLRAFAEIQRRHPDATLTIAGSGSQRTQLERLGLALGLRGVVFVGAVPPDQMGRWYDRAGVYLNSPRIDNMPLSILEAFACGVPVVSTDAGGVPWMVRSGENGLLVPAGDHHALATAAMRILEEPGLGFRLAATARTDVETRYTWAAVAPQWASLVGRPGPEAA